MRFVCLGLALALAASTAGCGALGSSSDSAGTGSGSVERDRIQVAVLPVIDTAPLWVAVDKKYFEAEGLTVEPVLAGSGPDAVTSVIAGGNAIGFSSYPSAIAAYRKLDADNKVTLVADGYAAKPNTFMTVAAPDSPVRTPADLAGRRVAVTARGTISDLATMAVLRTQQVDVSTIQWAEMPFPKMIEALLRNDVDAAVLAEPFLTQYGQQLGDKARRILDCASGPANEIPLAGWISTQKFVTDNPKTVAAFQRALSRGVTDITQSRPLLNQTLIDRLKIDSATADRLTLGTFSPTLDGDRIQRVADLMHQFPDVTSVTEPFDVTQLLSTPPGR
jgi:NitT/TauT family transport system substrate-binding protein